MDNEKIAKELVMLAKELVSVDNKLWKLGKDVTYALPRGESSLKPSQKGLKDAAGSLGISVAQARKALDYYNSN